MHLKSFFDQNHTFSDQNYDFPISVWKFDIHHTCNNNMFASTDRFEYNKFSIIWFPYNLHNCLLQHISSAFHWFTLISFLYLFFDTTLLYFRWFYKLRALVLRFHFYIFPLWFWTLTIFLIRFWLVKQKSRRETWFLLDIFGNNKSIDDSMWNLKSRLRERIHARFFGEKCIFRDFIVF